MPDYTDLYYFRDGIGYRLWIELRDDNDNYVNVNKRFYPGDAGHHPCYFNCLPEGREPTVTLKTDGGHGVFTIRSSSLILDNTPWDGHDYGFWNAPLPLTIYDGSVAHEFKEWRRRRIRLQAETYEQASGHLETHEIGTFLIDDVATMGDLATLTLIGLHEEMTAKSADTIKDGADWYQGIPMGELIHMLVKRTDPDLDVYSSVHQRIDLGSHASMKASSWGPAPGWDSDGNPIPHHWIPRCSGPDMRNHQSYVIVGFEAPGNYAESGGGIARFNIRTGRWQLLAWPTSSSVFERAFPIFVWSDSATHVYAAMIQPMKNESFAEGFYRLQYVKVNVYGTTPTVTTLSSTISYWPAWWNLRRGEGGGGAMVQAGYYWLSNKFHGENLMLPFPQVAESLAADIDAHVSVIITNNRTWHGHAYNDKDEYAGDTDQYHFDTDPWFRVDRGGAYSMGIENNPLMPPYPSGIFARFWWKDHLHPPVLCGDGTEGPEGTAEKYIWFISLNGTEPVLIRMQANDTSGGNPGQIHTWALSSIDAWSVSYDHPLFSAQVNAICMAPGQPSGSPLEWHLCLSIIEWDEAETGSVTTSVARLLDVHVTDSGGSYPPGGEASISRALTLQTNEAAVYLWCPPKNTYDDYYHSTYDTTDKLFVVLYDRQDLSGMPYRLRQFDWSTSTWVADTNIPKSARPFAGFVLNHHSGRVHFIDQATGQAWSVTPGNTVWIMENDATPVHSSDRSCSIPAGLYAEYTAGDEQYIYWGMAPGPHGDITSNHFTNAQGKPSSARYQPGIYPWVQLSKQVADTIDVALMKGMDCWQVAKRMREIAQLYTLRITRSGQIQFRKRASSSSKGTLRLRTMKAVADVGGGEIPVDGYARRRTLYNEVRTAAAITPHEIVYDKPDAPQVLKGGGSTFGGDYLVDVNTKRPLALRLTCVSGGDILTYQGAYPTVKANTVLFRYERVLEAIHCHLVQSVVATALTIYVGGIVYRGGYFYSGEQEIRIGDTVQVRDGYERAITSLTSVGATSVRIALDGSVGHIDGDTLPNGAREYAMVTITPVGGEQSDDADGITELQGWVGPSGVAIRVKNWTAIREQMVLKIDEELLRVTGFGWHTPYSMRTVVVTRGINGTTAAEHDADAPIKGYVGFTAPNRMRAVGDTGVNVGIQYEQPDDEYPTDDEEVQRRCLAVGDGIIIRSAGYSLKPIDHAVAQAEDSQMADLLGRSELTISDNPFMDYGKASLVAAQVISYWAEPRVGVFGIEIPIWFGLSVGDTVEAEDPQWVPESEAPVSFEVVGIKYNLKTWTMQIDIRSFEPVAGTGARGEQEGKGGYGVPRGRKRYTTMPG